MAAGLNQKELAALVGVRVETLCRIETGKHTPSIETIQSIDRALKQAAKRGREAAGTQRPLHRAKAGAR